MAALVNISAEKWPPRQRTYFGSLAISSPQPGEAFAITPIHGCLGVMDLGDKRTMEYRITAREIAEDIAREINGDSGEGSYHGVFVAAGDAPSESELAKRAAVSRTGSTWTPDKSITVTRVQVQAKTAPSGRATNAIVRLTDGTTPANLTIAAAANDRGAITQNYAAGASLTIAVQTAAAGCATIPADANVVVQYRMQ